jgi:predicted MFS family arabinose efflux permease
MDASSPSEAKKPLISRSEWRLIFLLFAIQFTHTVDFVIMMPLGPQFDKVMGVSPSQFGILVGVYGFAAAIGSLLTATFLDKFDRKRCLLFLYAGFTISTLFCGLAPTFEAMLLARAFAGLFGGVVGVAVMAIVGDVFADYRRGTAMGAVMSAFGIASILGVPVGLVLAEQFDLWSPFLALAGLSAVVFAVTAFVLAPMRGHIFQGPKPDSHQFWAIVKNPNHQRAYFFSLVLVMSSFTVVPQIANYIQKNVGRPETDLKYFYLVGGLCTLVTMNVIGRLSDKLGKLFMFRAMAAMAAVMTLAMTNLPPASLFVVILVGTLFMVTASGRFVPAMAMITASAEPQVRGAFLGVNTCVQHIGMGLASVVGAMALGEVDGKMTGYTTAGILAACCGLLGLWVAGRLRSAETVVGQPVVEIPVTEPEVVWDA